MRPGRFQNPSKIMKNGTRGASGGVSGARLFQESVFWQSADLDFDVLAPLGRFLVLFRTPLDFEGGPKSHFFAEVQHKIEKNEVQEGVLKKHDSLLDF